MGLWTRKKLSELVENEQEGVHTLKKHLGSTQLILLGIGCVIGAGLFSITGIAAAQNAGPAITLAFLIAALGCAFSGLCYSELASMFPVAGSAYTYAYAALGEIIAWIIGWDLILEYAIGASAVAISWSAYVVSFLQGMGITLPVELVASPWQPVALKAGIHAHGLINLPAIIIVCLISCILILGIKESAGFNACMVVIKLAVVFIFIGLGFFYINPANYHPFLPENTGSFGAFGLSGLLRASSVLFFAYIGFDAVSTAGQEAKNPQKNIPIGILGSLAICTLLYVLFSLVMTGLINYKYLDVAAPVALAIDQTPFSWLQPLIKIAIITGLSSVILVLLLGQSRILFSMSKDGLLPPCFSKIHPTFHTPWLANLILMIFVSLIAGFAPLSALGHMTSIGTLLAFTIVCIGVMVLRYRYPEIPRSFRVPAMPIVPILGVMTCLVMMFSLTLETWVRLIIWLLIGFVLYFFKSTWSKS